jgi:transposase-like protein
VALDALRGEKTIAELAKLHDVHANQITSWKNELLEHAVEIFGGAASGADPAADREKIRELHAKIGELSMENDFLERVLGRFPGPSARK